MEKTTLGAGGISVSRLCFGTLTMSPIQRRLSPKEGAKLLEAAYERGVNFLDTAEIYENYPHIALALPHCPEMVVSTKCYAYDTKTAQQSWEKAVRGLGREMIDIFMLHEQESEHTLRGHAEAIEFFLKKKEQGLIRAFGISTHFVQGVLAGAKHPAVEIIHPIFNLSGIGVCDGGRPEMEAAVARAKAAGKGIFAMKPLGGGHLIRQRQQALQYVLESPLVDAVAMGMQSMAEVEYNCALFSGKNPQPFAKEIDALPRRLAIDPWCEGCGKCVERCKNEALRLENGRAEVDESKCVLCGYCATACPNVYIKVI